MLRVNYELLLGKKGHCNHLAHHNAFSYFILFSHCKIPNLMENSVFIIQNPLNTGYQAPNKFLSSRIFLEVTLCQR